MLKPNPNWFETLVRARRIQTRRLPESLPSSTSSTAESDRALTTPSPSVHSAVSTPPLDAWSVEHCANEPEPFVSHRLVGLCCSLVVLLLFLIAPPVYSAVHETGSIGLTVNDLDLEVR